MIGILMKINKLQDFVHYNKKMGIKNLLINLIHIMQSLHLDLNYKYQYLNKIQVEIILMEIIIVEII